MEFCADTPRKPSHEGEVDRSGGGDGIIAPAGVCSRTRASRNGRQKLEPAAKRSAPAVADDPIAVAGCIREAWLGVPICKLNFECPISVTLTQFL